MPTGRHKSEGAEKGAEGVGGSKFLYKSLATELKTLVRAGVPNPNL